MKKIMSVLMILGAMLCYALVITDPIAEGLSHGLLRFHIIAESNSDKDQQIKYDVRDYVSEKLSDADYVSLLDYAQKAEYYANEKLLEIGAPYRANADVERVFIPKKSYKNISLPSGRYNAVRLEIGKAEGENWWCVAYPSLCFSEKTEGELSKKGEEKLKNNLQNDEFELVKGEKKIKFFVVDLMGKVREYLM